MTWEVSFLVVHLNCILLYCYKFTWGTRATKRGGKFLPLMYLQMAVTSLSSDFLSKAVNNVVLPVIVWREKKWNLNLHAGPMTVIFPVSLIQKRDEPKMKNNKTYENPTITTNKYTSMMISNLVLKYLCRHLPFHLDK